MTVRLSGRELLIVRLSSFVWISASADAFPWPEWGTHSLRSALIAVLTALVILLAIREAMRRDTEATVPARASVRERTLKSIVFYLLVMLIPIGVFLTHARG